MAFFTFSVFFITFKRAETYSIYMALKKMVFIIGFEAKVKSILDERWSGELEYLLLTVAEVIKIYNGAKPAFSHCF